jgi:hypothetical protein
MEPFNSIYNAFLKFGHRPDINSFFGENNLYGEQRQSNGNCQYCLGRLGFWLAQPFYVKQYSPNQDSGILISINGTDAYFIFESGGMNLAGRKILICPHMISLA